jgi:NAD(P)-dependent dehydrogenase (short-subunit alcohol dehydrogenase family)
LLFAKEGASVGLLDHKPDLGNATAEDIKAAGGHALCVETDVSDPAQIESAVEAVASKFSGLDILYNNAGGATAKDGKVTDMPLDEFWRTIGVDLFGTFLGCRFAIPYLVERGGGSIINTTSIRAMIGTAGADAYTAAKGGVLTLTKSLALQWADKKIRVNAIAPGVVLSERVRDLVNPEDPIYKKSILGPSEPEDVAPLALFLASDESKQITGAILPVDSGASAI